MLRRSPRARSLLLLACLAWLAPVHARAAVTVYTTLASFQAAAPTASLGTDFESLTTGYKATFTSGGITFSSTLNNLYVIGPTLPGTTSPLPPTHMLSANGEEDITMTLVAGSTSTFGFTLLTNAYGGHTLYLFDTSGVVFFTYHPTQAANTIGFLGFVSDTPIGKARWVAGQGQVQNTALDNIYYDVANATPAAGSTWGRIKSLYR